MKKVAILIVQLDTISNKYETQMIYPQVLKEDFKDIYISSSDKVELILSRIAVGPEAISELEKTEQEYLSKNK